MYVIGQVLFVVLSKKNQVYPMQVIEVITKKTLNGEEISYVLQAGSDKDNKVTLSQVDGEVFNTAEDAKRTLVQRATSQIIKLVDAATRKAGEWYGFSESQVDSSPQTIQDLPEFMLKKTPAQSPAQDASTSVVMPDGSVVNIKLPEILRDHG